MIMSGNKPQPQKEKQERGKEEIEATAQGRKTKQGTPGEHCQRSQKRKQSRDRFCAEGGQQRHAGDQRNPQPGRTAIFPAGTPCGRCALERAPPVHKQREQNPGQADQRQDGEIEPPGHGRFTGIEDAAGKLALENIHNIVGLPGSIEHDQPGSDEEKHEQKAEQTVPAIKATGRTTPEQKQHTGDQGEGQRQRPLDQDSRSGEQKGQGKPEGSFRLDPAPVKTG